MIGPLAAYPVTQLGFVVSDLDEAMTAFGGTWQRPEIPPDAFQDIVYRGGRRCSTTWSRSATEVRPSSS